jgi:hypothetical protein
VVEKIKSLGELDFYDSIAELDCNQVDYIDFYNSYLNDFAEKHYGKQDDSDSFTALVRELKLFDHLQKIEELKNGKNSNQNLENFVFDLVDRMLVQNEIDRVLNDNFVNVLQDVDKLVRDEYYEITGEHLESAIFDKEKVGDEIDEAIDQERSLSYHYVHHLENDDSEEKPTFDRNDTNGDERLFVYDNDDDNTYYSSYPVEEIQST